jgi:RNA polymerase sigma-70 factor (ECF subfamily)
MGHPDAELIRRWQRGDVAAFEALVRRWQQPVGRFLARLVGRSDLAEDLCQDVFLRVYLAGARYRETGAFSTWLYRIALNAARDAGRRRKHHAQPLDDVEPAGGHVAADVFCEQEEVARAVAGAVAELPPPLREVLVLRHYEGMSFEEMGRLLEVPASTLKSRFAAALGRLRQRLHHLGRDPEEIDR